MDTETVSPNFDDIRPLNNSEVKDAIEKLVANEDFERALRYICLLYTSDAADEL